MGRFIEAEGFPSSAGRTVLLAGCNRSICRAFLVLVGQHLLPPGSLLDGHVNKKRAQRSMEHVKMRSGRKRDSFIPTDPSLDFIGSRTGTIAHLDSHLFNQ